jgi:hypothetical protein
VRLPVRDHRALAASSVLYGISINREIPDRGRPLAPVLIHQLICRKRPSDVLPLTQAPRRFCVLTEAANAGSSRACAI